MSDSSSLASPSPPRSAAGSNTDPGRHDVPFVTVVMPVRDEEDFIERALESVLAQRWPQDRFEILVVDGRSTDRTRALVAARAAEAPVSITILDNPGQTAPCALNVGLQAARGDVIVRVDGHCEIGPDYLPNGVRHLLGDATRADGVGGPLETIPLDPDDRTAEAIAIAMSSAFGVGGSDFRTRSSGDFVRWVDTVAFPAYTRDAIERAGLFDEELVRNQDDEYNYRLRSLGGRIALAGDMPARYYARSSFRKLWRQYRQYGFWKVRVLQKHPRQMRWRQFVPGAFVGSLAAAALAVPILGKRPLAALLTAYLAANGAATVATLRQRPATAKATLAPRLALAFALQHVGYGVGFVTGLVRFARGFLPGRER